jgi:hypothetical protein
MGSFMKPRGALPIIVTAALIEVAVSASAQDEGEPSQECEHARVGAVRQ